jgi:hypothetical protein
MSEEYLWDKTGSDPEIERMETALRNFAYKEKGPPQLPARVLTLSEARPRWFFSLRMAFAMAFVVMLSLGLGALVFVQKRTATDQVRTVAPPQDSMPTPPPTRIEEPETKPTIVAPPISKKDFVPVRHNFVPQRRVVAKTVHKPIRRESEVKFTNEELYAYNQLMLALSITSSKLKIVNDKVNGSDGQVADTADSR